MALSNGAPAASTPTEYITEWGTISTKYTLTRNFCGTFFPYGGCIAISAANCDTYVQLGSAGAPFCDLLLAKGTCYCYQAGSGGLATGYLFD